MLTITDATVFARGMTISADANPSLPSKVRPYWTENGKALRKFCDFCKNDERIDVVLLPLFDGVTWIKWAGSALPLNGQQTQNQHGV
jgi:predicted O-methyltransferase YrrM